MKRQRFLILILLTAIMGILIALGGCAYVTGEAIEIPRIQVVKDITTGEASALIQANEGNAGFSIIDVRTPQEYADGHIENAVNIDYNSESFRAEINRFDRDKTYLIYCRSGRRSAGARDVMADLGFKEVYNLEGGIIEWEAAGLPVVK